VPSLQRQLYSLAWPAFAENVLQTALGVVSLLLVGQLGTEAVAAVGLANQIYFLAITILMGWSIGTTALVARQSGAGQSAQAGAVASQSLLLAGGAGLAMAAVAYPLARVAMLAAGATAEVADVGEPFLQWIAFSIPGVALMLVGGGALRGAGDTRTPMYVTGVANLVNIALAYALVLGAFGAPRMGVAGAGAAILASRTVGAAILTWLLFRRVGAGWPRFQLDLARRIGRIGGPAAAEQFVVQLGFVAFNLIAIRIGTAEFASMQIAFNVAQVSQLAGMAFATAATTLVGQSLGARQPERAAAAGWWATGTAVVWMVLMGVVFILFGDAIFRLYGADEAVRERGRVALLFMGVGQAPQAIAFVLAGALRGAGDTRATFLVGLVGTCGLRVLVAYGLGILAGVGYPAIWLAWISDWLLRSVLFVRRFRSGRWATARV
jgi:putative MATE family efflux protein